MNAYIYQAAVWCEDCAWEIIARLRGEDTGDSDDWPQGPYAEGGGEADCPQHCDAGAHCLNAAHGAGVFLENPLTADGYAYVRAIVHEAYYEKGHHHNSGVVGEWREFYDIADEEEE